MLYTMSAETAHTWRGRYAILVFDCLLVFGIYYNVDLPSAVQSFIQNSKGENCSSSEDFYFNGSQSCCKDCLGLGPDKYNQLYSIFSWTNAVLVFPAGIFADRYGNRKSSLLFTGLTTIGSVLFGLALLDGIQGTNNMFILMLAGRLFIGAGTGSSRIVQDRVVAVWFRDKLSFAFSIVGIGLRLGSVINFLVTPTIAETYNLNTAVWIGAVVCSTCFISAIMLSILDWHGSGKSSENTGDAESQHRTTLFSRIRNFPVSFWLICIMLASYYCFLIPFIANGGKFFENKYGYNKKKASYINGIMYDTSVIVFPLLGQLIDKLGLRGILSTTGGFLTIPLLAVLLQVDKVSPILIEVLLGIQYAFVVIPLWPSIALIVPRDSVGTGNGIALLMMHSGVGLTNFCIGKILGDTVSDDVVECHTNWIYVFSILMGHLVVTTIAGITLNIVDLKTGSILNRRKQDRKEYEMIN